MIHLSRSLRCAALLLWLLLPSGPAATASEPDSRSREADVYLVPIGGLPHDLLAELAGYYQEMLGLDVEVTGPLPFEPSMLDDERGQYIGEELLLAMGRGFRGWARNPRALFVGVTELDIYTTAENLRFVFALRRGDHLAVVSGARMIDSFGLRGAWPPIRVARLRKMVTKTIAMQHLGLPLSLDPTSVLYGRVLSLNDLDRIDESRIRPDVIEPSRTRERLVAAKDPGDLLALGHPTELLRASDGKKRRQGLLIVGGIVAYVCSVLAYVFWNWRRTEAAWRGVADRHGWRFFEADGPWYKRGSWRIELQIDGVPAVVDWIQVGSYRAPMLLTRIRSEVPSAHEFRIAPESFYSRIRKRFGGLREIEIGDPYYDRAFLVMCDAADWLRHHLSPELRARHLALRAMLFAGNGKLEILRFQIIDNQEDLLSLIQLHTDTAAAIRERTPVSVAPAPSPEAAASFPLRGAEPRAWIRHVARALAGIGIIEFVGAIPITIIIQTEHTNVAWGIGLPWAGGLTLATAFYLFMSAKLSGSSSATRTLAIAVALPMIFFWYWMLSGPWVNAWNAFVGRPHPEGLYGPVIEKRVLKGDQYLLVLPHPSEERMIRIRVAPHLFTSVRPGDPMGLDATQGSLGIFYWPRE